MARPKKAQKPNGASGDLARGATSALDNLDSPDLIDAVVTDAAESGVTPAQAFISRAKMVGLDKKPTAMQQAVAGIVQGTMTDAERAADAGGEDRIQSLRWWGQISYWYETHDEQGNLLPNAPSEQAWCDDKIARFNAFFADYADEGALIFHDADTEYVTDESGKKVLRQKPLHLHFEFVAKHRTKRTGKAVKAALAKAGLIISREKNLGHVSNWASTTQYLIHISEGAMADRKHVYNVRDVMVWLRGKTQADTGWVDESTANAWMQKNLFGGNAKVRRAYGLADAMAWYMRICAAGILTLDQVRDELLRDERRLGLAPKDLSKVMAAAALGSESYDHALQRWYDEHTRQLVTVYIHGAGGSGKTELALALAKRVAHTLVPNGCADGGVHLAAAKGDSTYDPFGTYEHQSVSVYDEFDLAAFGLNRFLTAFSPTRAMLASARYHDRLYHASWAFLAQSYSLESVIGKGFDAAAAEAGFARRSASKADRESWTGMDYRADALANPELANKLYQAHRRIAIDLELNDDNSADIYIRNDVSSAPAAIYDDQPQFDALQIGLPDVVHCMRSDSAFVHRVCDTDTSSVWDVYLSDDSGKPKYMVRSRLRDESAFIPDGVPAHIQQHVRRGNMLSADVYAGWGPDARRIATWRGCYPVLSSSGSICADDVVSALRDLAGNTHNQFAMTSYAAAPGPRYDHFVHVPLVDSDDSSSISSLWAMLRKAERAYYELNGYKQYAQTRPVFCPVHLHGNLFGHCGPCARDARRDMAQAAKKSREESKQKGTDRDE